MLRQAYQTKLAKPWELIQEFAAVLRRAISDFGVPKPAPQLPRVYFGTGKTSTLARNSRDATTPPERSFDGGTSNRDVVCHGLEFSGPAASPGGETCASWF
jgi:hypothetical protein